MSDQGASTLDFPQHLAALRKHHGLTQQALAERVGVHVVQLRRYEGGTRRWSSGNGRANNGEGK